MEWIVPFVLTVITASTPLLLAATGELITEKSGVLNLGVEGMMLVGAIAGFAVTASTGSATVGILAAVLAGAMMSLIFAFLTLTLMANQVATGLALTIFGVGFSALVGSGFVGFAIDPLPALAIPGISAIPIIGPILFGQDFLVYLSIAVVIGVGWFLAKSRAGLVLKAVGDSHHSAHAIGYSVIKIRYLATMFGGAMAGLGGAYLSLSYTPMWAENMTAGRGWIALALVVFATWRPGRLVAGAYMFGLISVMQLHAQGAGIHVPSQFMSMLPYLATVIVLVIISSDRAKIRLNAPACIGQAFRAAQ
ncbi:MULTISPECIES: ABC transporter permease [Thalassospira]|jgi:simple sugar transport system permease protein|uniref:ABC transporter permease n=1 Tax=Thalassospira profundimaris TaxID=502049 RepID=A0A367VLB5_9PROT|nr:MULTISPECIES: ABC transporter permease [Thalassospira]MBR9899061.1 ABC transporter permease [Rhodospirillales bacterium]KZB71237.1 ABC transporter permease [Thalassospira sp. MCCC 1A01148]MBC46101.1 ABC transporter permease [Thalassospira sp.]MBO6806276.1 ABC transporter permease [Thalassospira sp.]MBO6839202.1 ABC transporter permease [Thalassospira sp.]|tara:strand:+ start:8625 stop:9545 length:921 start_codon:yes stop_codon:yes gene_type:complete